MAGGMKGQHGPDPQRGHHCPNTQDSSGPSPSGLEGGSGHTPPGRHESKARRLRIAGTQLVPRRAEESAKGGLAMGREGVPCEAAGGQGTAGAAKSRALGE